MPDKVLKVNMLGGFSVYYGDKEIVSDRNGVSKTLQLLQLVLFYQKKGLPKVKIIEALYSRDSVENKNASLNNTIFRLRKQLKTAGLPGENYIIIQDGICKWEENCPVEVDCWCLQEILEAGQRENDEEKRMEAFSKGCALYKGEFLPNMIGEDWVAVQNIRFRDLYFPCLEELCHYLHRKGHFEEIYRLTSAAANIYPFEDWQIWKIASLIAMGRFKEAMDVYRKITEEFFDDMGLTPTPEMLERFRVMGEKIQQSPGAIEEIKSRLREKESGQGAYYCTFPSFIDIYHVVSRKAKRKDISVYIMLCTLKNKNGQVYGEGDHDRAASEILKKAITSSLRKGDFYTKYNYGQYLVMLSEIRRENCAEVSARIDKAFHKALSKSEYLVDYYVTSIEEISPGTRGAGRVE